MTITQLEYVVSLFKHRQFALAAEKCFVTQPTLSMQVQKLEEELGIKIFDRSKQPVIPTEAGQTVIESALKIVGEKDLLLESINEKKDIIRGELKIGVIPTLAPYLIPLFLNNFFDKHPEVKLNMYEITTENIIARLRNGDLDAGLLVTPLQEKGLRESVLFYEKLVAYVSNKHVAFNKKTIRPKDVTAEKLWLIEEGHCFRSQIINLCEIRKDQSNKGHFEYASGSIETLRRMVELNDGITIIPELATIDMNIDQKQHLRFFKHPSPVREVSLVVHRDFIKKKLLDKFKKEIVQSLPESIAKNKKNNVVDVGT